MRHLTTLIVFALVFTTVAKAQLAQQVYYVDMNNLMGPEAAASSYTTAQKAVRATLPNATNFRAESFASVRGDKNEPITVFVCQATSTEVVFMAIGVGEDFPLKFTTGEKFYARPITDTSYMRHFSIDYPGLCKQCRIQPTAAL